ncbi:MAG: ATP-binding protein [Thermoproteota archaeon]|nr:ATP-binding protein [Thermoproteota archaeon]
MKHNKTFIIILISIASSILLGIFTYNYFTQTANQIEDLQIDSLQTNAEIEVFSISNILTNSIHYVKYNLDRISTSPSSIEGNLTRIQSLLDIAQASTSNLTDGYYFLDTNGTVLTYSEIDKGTFPNYKGINLSQREYFQIPRQNGTFFISTVIDSNDKIPRIYISAPVFEIDPAQRQEIVEAGGLSGLSEMTENATSPSFRGVVVSAIAAQKLGDFLESQIHAKFNGDVSFIDRNGTIIHAANQTYIGKNYFGNDFQAYLKSVLKDEEEGFNKIINNAFFLQSGVDQFDFENTSTTIAYKSVWGPQIGNYDTEYRIGTLFITVPNTLAENVSSLVENQTATNFTIIGVIVAVLVVTSIILLRWNEFLNDIVKQKTLQLRETIEKLRKANEELKSYELMQKEFINVAAHELRTPTQIITANLELIKMAHLPSLFQDFSKDLSGLTQDLQIILKDNNKIRSFSSVLISVYRNAKRLEKLMSDILDTSRIENNKLELYKESFNLNEKIRNVIKDIHSKTNLISSHGSPSNQVNIEFETKEDPINVLADKIRIFEVISNLINNAIKFSNGQTITISSKKMLKKEIKAYLRHHPPHNQKEGSTVSIENKDKDGDDAMMMAVVSIRDKGKGIDPDIYPRLFTKFTTKSHQGTGLGLYIAKSIVEAHGGQIWAQNNFDEGKGATFSFSLPLIK